jgi:methylmalonyl-CoA mutase cobalamin-binding subunit
MTRGGEMISATRTMSMKEKKRIRVLVAKPGLA